MCAGVVPQQPPRAWAPALAISSIHPANSSGPTSKTVRPSSSRGRPALGSTRMGREVSCRSRRVRESICWGPRPQLSPKASTPRPSSTAAAASRVPPVRSFPSSSKVMVTNTGREQCSLAASTAAFASYRSFMVSMRTQSAPAWAPASTTWAKASKACSKGRSPRGASSFPVGPMSRATKASFPLWATASRARATPALTSVSAGTPSSSSFRGLAPKVLALITWAPASR